MCAMSDIALRLNIVVIGSRRQSNNMKHTLVVAVLFNIVRYDTLTDSCGCLFDLELVVNMKTVFEYLSFLCNIVGPCHFCWQLLFIAHRTGL